MITVRNKAIKPHKRIHRGKSRIFLSCAYDPTLIQWIKSIPGRQYSKTYKEWHIPDTEDSLNYLQSKTPKPQENPAKTTKIQHQVVINEYWMSKVDSFEQYLAQQRYASQTISAYRQALLQFLIWWNNRDISELNLSAIKAYNYAHFIKEKRSYSAQNVWVNALKLFLAKESNIRIDISDIERPKKGKHLPDVLSEDEVRRLISSYKNLKHQTIIMMYYACGMRKSELINLKLSDMDSKRRIIRIRNSKGAKDRDVPMPEALLVQIVKYYNRYKPRVYLFNGLNKPQYSARSIDKVLERGLSRCGIKKQITVHNLRHSYATHLVERNINLRYIQEALGHNSSKTTELYTRLSKENIANMVSPIDFWTKNKENI